MKAKAPVKGGRCRCGHEQADHTRARPSASSPWKAVPAKDRVACNAHDQGTGARCLCDRYEDELDGMARLFHTNPHVQPQAAPERVEAYRCPNCKAIHEAPGRADACCRCSVCGAPSKNMLPPRTWMLQQICGHCVYPQTLKNAQASVKDAAKKLREEQKRLRALVKKGRPKRGSDPRKLG